MNYSLKKLDLLRKVSMFTFAILLSLSVKGQELKMRGSLGIQMRPLTDSAATANNVEKGKGLFIDTVFPNTTAEKAGMKAGAILTKINGEEVNSFDALFGEISDLRADDIISLTFYQDGKEFTKKQKATARSKEVFEQANIYYEQVEFPGNQLRSILYTPKGVDNPPVVYFLQGYTCSSFEFSRAPNFTVRKLIQDWVLSGYAFYRVEKANAGDSQCDVGCSELNFDQEVEGFRQGYLNLQKDERIDSDNIFVFGLSLGGIVAPILAEEFKPKGVITYGVLVNSWFEYMQDLTRIQGEMFNTPYAEIERDLRRSLPFWYELMVAQKTNTEILKNESIRKQLADEGILEAFEAGQFMDRHYTFWQTLNDISLYNIWPNVESNVLALYGEYDIQALNADHIVMIADMVNSKHPGKGDYQVIKNSDHGFVYFESMADNIVAHENGQYGARLHDSYNNGTALATIGWMNKLR